MTKINQKRKNKERKTRQMQSPESDGKIDDDMIKASDQ